MTTNARIRLVPLIGLVVAAACVDLQVTNPNAPERERALTRGSDVEALLSSNFPSWWNLEQGVLLAPGGVAVFTSAFAELNALADVATTSASEIEREPRHTIINDNNYRWGDFEKQSFLQLYRGQSSIRDGLRAVKGGVVVGTNGADAPRLQAYAKLLQGLAQGHIAELYDQGYVFDENTADMSQVKLVPYTQVLADAMAKLEQAQRLAAASTFTIPSGWLGPKSYTSQDLVRIAHSYEARFMAQSARTPAERQKVDWAAVLNHIQLGVTADYGVELSGPGGVWRTAKGRMDVDLPFLGPADQSGGWQTHEKGNPPGSKKSPFIVDTDDRRLGTGRPATNGTMVRYHSDARGDPSVGLYTMTYYELFTWEQIGNTSLGFAPDLTVQEMEFYKAEAYIRMGQPANALPIINKTRVAAGLPPATVSGVSGPRCVPRTVTGACGNLLETLAWEKALQLVQLSMGNTYFEQRGMGTLRVGNPLHLPVPQLELYNRGLPWYTTGGVGGRDAAPGPAGLVIPPAG